MRVCITGASGFIGSHIARELIDGGHAVTAYVRSPERLRRALSLHGAPPVDVVQGELTDREALRAAAAGADAMIHCAAVYSTDGRRSREVWATNVEATRAVLGTAAEAGCDPVVHVSSVTALFPMRGMIAADGPDGPPLGTSRFPYSRSKRVSEEIARELQAAGAPVVITYPGGVFGPCDPGPGEQLHILSNTLRNRTPFILPGGKVTVADVRWVARAHAALMEPGKGPRRILMGGRCLAWKDYVGELRRATGRRLPLLLLSPKAITWLTGLLLEGLQRVLPFRLPFGHEMAMMPFYTDATDDAEAEALAGPPPPARETLVDAVSWLADQGHLPAKLVGQLSSSRPKELAE